MPWHTLCVPEPNPPVRPSFLPSADAGLDLLCGRLLTRNCSRSGRGRNCAGRRHAALLARFSQPQTWWDMASHCAPSATRVGTLCAARMSRRRAPTDGPPRHGPLRMRQPLDKVLQSRSGDVVTADAPSDHSAIGDRRHRTARHTTLASSDARVDRGTPPS